jgi:hypothetical protein
VPDPFQTDLQHTIRLAWKTMDGQIALKGFATQSDDDLRLMGLSRAEFNQMLVGGTWGCGDSASRLCQLLVGDELGQYRSAADATDVSDERATAAALTAMTRSAGRVLVRLNVIGGNAGHSYVFVSGYRTAGDPLVGLIYQTNVGCDAMFDLRAWLDDPKSRQTVDLRHHLLDIRGKLVKRTDAPGVYQQEYMLTGTGPTAQESTRLSTVGTAARLVFQWRPVNEATVATALASLRRAFPTLRRPVTKWAPVATKKGFRSTG